MGSFPKMYSDPKILPNISTLKKSRNQQVKPKKPLDHLCHLKSRVSPPPLHHTCQFCNALGRIFLEENLCVLKTKKKRVLRDF